MENEAPTRQRLYEDQEALLYEASCIRDKALQWVGELVDEKASKGIGAALTAFDRLQERVERMEDRLNPEPSDTETEAYEPVYANPRPEYLRNLADAIEASEKEGNG